MIITQRKDLLGNEFYCKACDIVLKNETSCPICGENKLIFAALANVKWCQMCGENRPEKGKDACAACEEYYRENLARYKFQCAEETPSFLLAGGGNAS